MSGPAERAWRCLVCGYVHRGPQAPEVCPVCGAAAADFESYAEAAPQASPSAPRQWQCLNCNYIHEGDRPPEVCPVCGETADRFAPVTPEPAAPESAGGRETEVVIVGGGIAGVSAAEAVRAASPGSGITLLCEESSLPYYRLNLTRLLAGEIDREALPIHPRDWYESRGIRLMTGDPASSIVSGSGRIALRSGAAVGFEKLILAMGSHPFVPPLDGAALPGVYSLRTSEDAQAILDKAAEGAPCVCIGGGVLGLETATALARRGADVTLLESHGWLMPRQLNPAAGELLAEHITEMGVRLRRNARTAALRGTGRVEAVVLEDGAVLDAGLVILATGVRPNTHLARRAGLSVNKGILVDSNLRTSHPGIFAAGDVAEHNGTLYGIWGASQYQGSIAGLNAVGIPTLFGGLPRSNSLKILGIDLSSIGQFEPPDGSFITVDWREGGEYMHFVFHDGRLVGSILFGKTPLGPVVKRAVEQGIDFSGLLATHPSAREVTEHLASLPGAWEGRP